MELEITLLIEKILNAKGKPLKILPLTALFSSGLLDSISGMELILFLEQKYDLDFFKNNLEISDIDSVQLILAALTKAGARGGT